jgi:serine/threonine protein kinase
MDMAEQRKACLNDFVL